MSPILAYTHTMSCQYPRSLDVYHSRPFWTFWKHAEVVLYPLEVSPFSLQVGNTDFYIHYSGLSSSNKIFLNIFINEFKRDSSLVFKISTITSEKPLAFPFSICAMQTILQSYILPIQFQYSAGFPFVVFKLSSNYQH